MGSGGGFPASQEENRQRKMASFESPHQDSFFFSVGSLIQNNVPKASFLGFFFVYISVSGY